MRNDKPMQLSLPGLDTAEPVFEPEQIANRRGQLLGYTLFLAAFPQPDDALRIAATAAKLRHQLGLVGASVDPHRLHITLHDVLSFRRTTPLAGVMAARAAAASVACPPLPVTFDHGLSFPASNAFVLRCNASSDAATARLRQSLTIAMKHRGLQAKESRTPHMTICYDSNHLLAHTIEPLCWTATRFALIVSHVGCGHHQWLDDWALRSQG